MTKQIILYILIIFSLTILPASFKIGNYDVPQARAEEDDDDDDQEENEDRDEDEEKEDDDDEYQTQTEQIIETPDQTIIPEQQTVYIKKIDSGYNVDTDKDGLVDAIDPDPSIPQQLFFTDSDNDGVQDAADHHPGENDFDFVDFIDQNSDGILDSFQK